MAGAKRGLFTQARQQAGKTSGFTSKISMLTASMMLVGSASYMYYNKGQMSIPTSFTVAEAEQAPAVKIESRIHKKIKLDCHLSIDPKRQTLFVIYDSSNALQKEFMSEVEAK